MSFVSPEFAFAALLFFPLFWRLNGSRRLQLAFLMFASYAVYASWSGTGAALLFGYSVVVWQAGELINAADGNLRWRRFLLSVGLLLALSVLLLSKYYEFLRLILVEALPASGLVSLMPVLDFVAPAGVSFYTFQAITYLVWRYQTRYRRVPPVKALAFLSFWPTLFAGPILRAADFFKEIESPAFGQPRDVARAIYLILLGLTQKMVFSSWLAEQFVDTAFRYPDGLNALTAGAAMWAYTLQIFLDFSGYSLIVTGLALLLGYAVPVNFRQPYLARNLREFWRGWHITLSTFIRDYIYIPLGGNQRGFTRMQVNLMVAMLLSGIWHGANTTFLIWGALHGLGVVLLNVLEKFGLGRLPRFFGIALTLAYVSLAWVFFRANSVEEAWFMLQALAVAPAGFQAAHAQLVAFSILFFVLSARALALEKWATAFFEHLWGWRLAVVASVCCFAVIHFGPSGIPAFIYYRF